MGHWRHRRSLHNRRSELAAASVGTNRYGYAYDTIGNRLWSAANAVTNSYAANCLNQYTSVSTGASPVYDADGNMTGDGTFVYSYDAENRLVSAYPVLPFVGSIAVENRYDHRHRRVQKIVKRYDGEAWETAESRTFVWDGNNIILEKVEFADGTTRTFEYFWGADKSGTEQGAGGVEGLLAVSMDGVFYIPCYDHNGNIVLYVSEAGSIAAQYVYDPYGGVVDSYGNLADVFNFGFSTKYHDRETGMIGYQRRFYSPVLGRWLNRDPIEEDGGENLYMFCANGPCFVIDVEGLSFLNTFLSSIQVLGGLGLVVAGSTLGAGTSWSGVGAVAGFGMVALGVDQALAGIRNLSNRAKNLPITDETTIKSFNRYVARTVSGESGSALESSLDSLYAFAEMSSACYGAIVSVQSVIKTVRPTYVPAHTVKEPILEGKMIHWTYSLKAACWRLEGKDVIFESAFDFFVEGSSHIEPEDVYGDRETSR